jgi:hypothetical protein
MSTATQQATRTSYAECLATSERVRWRVEDLIGGDKQLDFSRRFLPEDLARVDELEFLSEHERLVLNQIRGHEYLRMFVNIEAFIMPFVLEHARSGLHADDIKSRALLGFLNEEAKHTHLFNLFAAEFDKGFGSRCDCIGPAEEIAVAVGSHHPLGVALVILMAEWVTQAHYLQSVRDDRALDPVFCDMLKHHWIEEAQHAKLDTLIVESLGESLTADEIAVGVDAFFEIGGVLDSGLQQQVQLVLEAFERATGRTLDDDQRRVFLERQLQAIRWTFVGSGMVHPRFLESIERLSPGSQARVEETAQWFR